MFHAAIVYLQFLIFKFDRYSKWTKSYFYFFDNFLVLIFFATRQSRILSAQLAFRSKTLLLLVCLPFSSFNEEVAIVWNYYFCPPVYPKICFFSLVAALFMLLQQIQFVTPISRGRKSQKSCFKCAIMPLRPLK